MCEEELWPPDCDVRLWSWFWSISEVSMPSGPRPPSLEGSTREKETPLSSSFWKSEKEGQC